MALVKWLFKSVLGSRVPVHAGTLASSSLHEPVTISRDKWGVPTISARNDRDAWFALGFCQGQDRCFQINLFTRMARGSVAEWFGKRGIPNDKLSRRIGFHRMAQKQFANLEPESAKMLQSFAAGINEGFHQGLEKRPHEMALLRLDSVTFEAADTLAIIGLMSFLMPSNWDRELTRLRILIDEGAEALQAIESSPPEWFAVENKAAIASMLDLLAKELTTMRAHAPTGGGSNNWVIGGEKTKSGKPILANDPHLGPLIPPHWYLSRIVTPNWEVTGATFAAAPGYLCAHNGRAAWGITAGHVDNVDLFLEKIDGNQVLRDGKWIACDVIEETIKVRGGKPVVEKILITPSGPLLSPALDGEFPGLSFSAAWSRADSAKKIFQLHRSRNFEEFRAQFEDWSLVSLNLVYADEKEIGWQLIGQVPKRKKGFGLIPLPAWDPEVGWETDLVAFEKMPWVSNPPERFYATANNKPPSDDDVFLAGDWLQEHRVETIRGKVAARNDWTAESTRALQMDTQSHAWTLIREKILASLSSSRTKQLLESWDGYLKIDSEAASLFSLLVHSLNERAIREKAPKSVELAMGKGFCHELFPYSTFAVRMGWICELVRTQPKWFASSDWTTQIREAAHEAEIQLSQFSNKGWGYVRPMELLHPFGEIKPLRSVFNAGPFPVGGDAYTISQVYTDPLKPLRNPLALANLRAVFDLGNLPGSRFVLAGGQSGNPLSPNYRDLLELWKKGEGILIDGSAREQTLTLTPL